jgi:hypothetical protein
MNTSSWETKYRRPILLIGAGLIASWYGALLGAYALVPALKRAVETRAADVLRGEFGSDVRFQSFDVTFLPRVRIVARGVLAGHGATPPLIQTATVDVWSDLLHWHIRMPVLKGLSLNIPPAKGPSVTTPESAFTVTIDQIVAEPAQLEIVPSDSQQTTFHFEKANLRVKHTPNPRARH